MRVRGAHGARQSERIMVPNELYRLLRCPSCYSRNLVVNEAAVSCGGCGVDYPRHAGYLDLMPRGVAYDYTSKYVAEEAQLAEELDYREIAPPLLAAGVRNRALVRLLALGAGDVVLDNGCGNGRFAVWNRERVALMVGNDPATMFADEALAQIALTQADSRRLPFADGAFDKSFSIDVLEHFPREVIDAYLAETARVLRPGGRFLAFSNTSEPSSLQPLTNLSRRIGRLFVRAGIYDFEREARRKSDHIKALRTFEDVLAAMRQAGLRPVRIVFWNSVFTSFVEHVVMKLGEAWLARRRAPAAPGPVGAGTSRELRARQAVRGRLRQRGGLRLALELITRMMELDLWLFGRLRSGSYFIVVEK
jgi:ubiquinone/menaquinone biosynthesis C-methylase UbiE